jgi:hypothetical protein
VKIESVPIGCKAQQSAASRWQRPIPPPHELFIPNLNTTTLGLSLSTIHRCYGALPPYPREPSLRFAPENPLTEISLTISITFSTINPPASLRSDRLIEFDKITGVKPECWKQQFRAVAFIVLPQPSLRSQKNSPICLVCQTRTARRTRTHNNSRL